MGQVFPKNPIARLGGAARAIPFIAVVYLFLAYAAYSIFTSQIPSGNDFYPRWRGTRALIVEGKDPYSDEVTLEIQMAMYGRLARDDEDQVAFAYPLYVSLLVLPFSLFSYPQAQALWLSTLILSVLATVIVILRTLEWKLSLAGLTMLSLWFLFFYPTARSIILGQFSIIVLALLALALWAMERGHPFLAGCSLALATVKPQMVFLVIPFLLLAGLRWRRYKMLAGFLAVMAILLILSSLVLPSWLASFVTGLSRYQAYTSIYREGRSPLGALIGYVSPPQLFPWATLLASLALVGYLVYVWIQMFRGHVDACRALFITIIVSLLVPVQTGTTNQVLLLLPLTYLLCRWGRNRLAAVSLPLILALGPWVLFLSTFWLRNGEHAIMAAPLPLVTLAMLWWAQRHNGRASSIPVGQLRSPGKKTGQSLVTDD